MPSKQCPQCAASFHCRENDCWCQSFPAVMTLTEEAACLCPACLKRAVQNRLQAAPEANEPSSYQAIRQAVLQETLKPVAGLDYYTDPNGYWVFTAWYLLRRGYCCKNGCRHCPYGFQK